MNFANVVRHVTDTVKIGIKQMREPYYQGFPAQMAFYMMLAIVPMVIVLSQILGLFNISVTYIYYLIDKYVSGDISDFLKRLFFIKTSNANNLVLMVMAIWAASKASLPMHRLANYTYTGGEYASKGLIRERVKSVIATVVMIVTIVFTLIVLVYGPVFINLVLSYLVENRVLDMMWTWLRWPLSILLYFMMVSINYYVLPSERMDFKAIVPGSIFCATGMMVVTVGYSAYASEIANYNIIYGSLSALVAMMFWLFFLAHIMCLGVIFNKAWAEAKNTRESIEI